jgi:hypothetical protein
MNGHRYGMMALALLASVGPAAAQAGFTNGVGDPESKAMAQPSQLRLTPAQRMAILSAVLQESAKVRPPPGLKVAVGAEVPASIELYTLPIGAMAQSPELRSLQYTMAQNQVVLVDPTTLRIVDVIHQ